MRTRAVVLAATIVMAPLGARAADLVVWWDEGYYAQEDEALREVIAAFEQETGKEVELVLHPMEELPDKIAAALEAGQPPDFAFGFWLAGYAAQWALRGSARRSLGRHRPLFGPVRSGSAGPAPRCSTQRRARRLLYGLPMGQITHLTHVWKSLLEQAGFTLEDIPQRVGSVLVLLVRPGAARRAPGHRARRHLGRGASDVGRSG